MWASNESAKKAANGTHFAIRIGNLQFDGGSNKTPRVKLMAKGLSGVGFDADGGGSDIYSRRSYAGPREASSVSSDRRGNAGK